MNSKDLAQFIDDSVQNTSINDLESQYKQISLMNDIYEGRGGIPVARRYKNNKEVVYIDDSLVNNLIVGRTRSGKTQDFVIPMIDIYSRAEEKSSLIIYDANNELYSEFKKPLELRGYEVIYFNIYDKKDSIKYNPLQLIKEAYKDEHYSEAQLLCNILTHSLYDDPNTKDPFWENSAKSLVNALILAICDEGIKNGEEDKITLYTVAKMLSELGGSSENIEDKEVNKLDEYFKKLPKESVAKSQYATISFADGNIRGAILSMAMSKLQNFINENISEVINGNSINFEEIGFNDSNPKAIFIGGNIYESNSKFLTSVFIRQVYFSLAKRALLSENKKCDREVIFILDDFCDISRIEGMDNIMSVCLGRNIKFNLVVRDFCQLDKLYGESAKTIIGNCGNMIYLGNSFGIESEIPREYLDKYIINKNKVDEDFLMEIFFSFRESRTSIVFRNKRVDNKGNKIIPYPIFNFEYNEMKSGNTYLECIKKLIFCKKGE